MPFQLPELPYALDALEPHISRRTLEFHYGKHHKGYIDKLNEAIQGTPFEDQELIEIVIGSWPDQQKIFNNASQAWNHDFQWQCLTPNAMEPSTHLRARLSQGFESFGEFKKKFMNSAKSLFGSGWTWLVKTPSGELKIRSLRNAGNPILDNEIPLLVCDVWEHAYYLDYQNERPKYLAGFWELINWDFVEGNLETGIRFPSPMIVSSSGISKVSRGKTSWERKSDPQRSDSTPLRTDP